MSGLIQVWKIETSSKVWECDDPGDLNVINLLQFDISIYFHEISDELSLCNLFIMKK